MLKYRATISHPKLNPGMQTFAMSEEYIDSWLIANESKIPEGATVRVYEVTEDLIRIGVVGTVKDGESKIEAAGLLKPLIKKLKLKKEKETKTE